MGFSSVPLKVLRVPPRWPPAILDGPDLMADRGLLGGGTPGSTSGPGPGRAGGGGLQGSWRQVMRGPLSTGAHGGHWMVAAPPLRPGGWAAAGTLPQCWGPGPTVPGTTLRKRLG